jgi:rod shape-determining protein MreC
MGFSRRRIKIIGSLVFASLILFCLPSSISEKLKLTGAGLLSPVRNLSATIQSWVTRTAPDPAQEARIQFLQKELHKQVMMNKEFQSRMGSLEGYDYEKQFNLVFADVIVSNDSSPWRGSMVIAKGSMHGVRKGQIVVFQQYLVGRIHETAPWTSRVLLAHDAAFKIGALVMSMRDSARQVGVAQGNGAKMVLRWISELDDVQQGQFVVTTFDPSAGVPKGLILGRVFSLDRSRGPHPDIVVEPSIRSRSLDHVVVLCPKEDR